LARPPSKPSSPHRPGHDSNLPEIDYDTAEPESAEQLQRHLLACFQSPDYRPPVLPAVAVELSELTRNEDASYDDVVAALQKDPLIVAGVLKVAQSSLYGGRGSLQSLKDAVQRLGINTLRDVVWQVVANMRLFHVRAYTGFMKRLQAHCMFMAHASRLVAMRAGIAAEHAFLCGLLHDVGISGTLIAAAESGGSLPALEFMLPAIQSTHEEAGVQIGTLWKLAPEIIAAIGQHHQYDPDRPGMPVLTAVLCVAESMADSFGYSIVDHAGGSLRGYGFDIQTADRRDAALKRLRLLGKEDDLQTRMLALVERMQA
jgi:putative nucleotidyltransferase with HDIG domain